MWIGLTKLPAHKDPELHAALTAPTSSPTLRMHLLTSSSRKTGVIRTPSAVPRE